MRPLRLSMTAFGPYAGTEVVDFEALAELGLFTVAGRNGSGKTTIFDGLHFALYGSLPGRRATYGRMRSDHARGDIECRVELDFAAQGRQWRVERLPKQRRAKRKGTGDTERAQRATLYEIVDGAPVAVVNRIAEVNEQCRSLVGLTGAQFERVALLPQGEFSRLLRESASERRELLRALFSSDVFGSATTLLTDAATEANQREAVSNDHFDRRLETVEGQISELVGRSVSNDLTQLTEALAAYRGDVLAPAAAQLEHARRSTAEHAASLQQAIAVADRLQRRTEVEAQLAEHERSEAEHVADRARLEAARAAVPVVDIAMVARNQRAAVEAVGLRVAALQHELTPVLSRIDPNLSVPDDASTLDDVVISVDEVSTRLADQLEASRQVSGLRRATGSLDAEVTRLTSSAAVAAEQRNAAIERRREADSERVRLEADADLDATRAASTIADGLFQARRSLAELDEAADGHRTRLAELQAVGASLDEQIAAADRARRDLAEQNDVARTAAETIAELNRRLETSRRFRTTYERLQQARRDAEHARRRADEQFDAFIRGASARIADTLVDGEPCAVCGSAQHPAPASTSADAVDEGQVSSARDAADRLATLVGRLEHELETLRETDPDIADIDDEAVVEHIEATTAVALASENAANDAARLVAALDELCQRRDQLVDQRAESAQRLADIDQQRNRHIGALGVDARQSVEHLQDRARRARERLSECERAVDRLRLIERELVELDTQVETIDLACLGLDRQLTATHAELDARRSDLAAAEAQLPDDAPSDVEQRLEVVARAARLLTRLRAALAEQGSAVDASRRAELTLTEKLAPSPFEVVDDAIAAHLETDVLVALEASTTAWTATRQHMLGELRALGELPDIPPDLIALRQTAAAAQVELQALEGDHARTVAALEQLESALAQLAADDAARSEQQVAARRLERVAALVKGDNAHNTSLENWVLAAHLRDVVELANVRLARSTQQRFQLCVLDEGESRRSRWGLDLAVEDTVTGTRRPTAGLSGGELFQASLALALGLADVVMNQSAGVAIDALFIDEGFGSLDDASVERVLDLLDDVRSRGATVGVITHVNALLDVLPRGITVVARPDGQGSTIDQPRRAA